MNMMDISKWMFVDEKPVTEYEWIRVPHPVIYGPSIKVKRKRPRRTGSTSRRVRNYPAT